MCMAFLSVLNVRKCSLGQQGKRLILYFYKKLICSSVDIEKLWRREWKGILFSFLHGTNHSKGVSMLLKGNVDQEVKYCKIDKNGRYYVTRQYSKMYLTALATNYWFNWYQFYSVISSQQSFQVQRLNKIGCKLYDPTPVDNDIYFKRINGSNTQAYCPESHHHSTNSSFLPQTSRNRLVNIDEPHMTRYDIIFNLTLCFQSNNNRPILATAILWCFIGVC